ncbi:hypothetical protein J5X84_16065 [Streptosporangiaceae bacterium NEAU-GS5]|nr:hypothetical protein [Streptosporangiaceae bacterium NEAU-GS5]
MDGFLDYTTGGLTELRIHGVSGTPPEGMLNSPTVRLVHGDRTTGFYRRWWPGGPPSSPDGDVPGRRHREAYAWGGLTSGGKMDALWLLLLPFALANLACFMLPRPAGGWARRLRHAVEAGQRLFALLLTAVLVNAAIRSSVDLIGWQCTSPGKPCAGPAAPVWIRWIGDLSGPVVSRRLAFTALVPLAVIALLWWLGRKTWQRDERQPMCGVGGQDRPLLARPRLWHGAEPVRRLRQLHIGFALGAVGLAVAAPFTPERTGLTLAVANAAVQGAAALLVVHPGIARRVDPGERNPAEWYLKPLCSGLRAAALAIVVTTIAIAFAGLRGSHREQVLLPAFGDRQAEFALLAALAVGLFAAILVLAVLDRPRTPPANPLERRAMWGLVSWFVMMCAAGAANALALGATFWCASFFGGGRPLELEDTAWWTATLIPVLGLCLVVVVVVLLRVRNGARRRLLDQLNRPPLDDFYERPERGGVAGVWALASLTDRAGLVLVPITLVGLIGTTVITVLNYGYHSPLTGWMGLLATAGSWAITTLVVGLFVLGRRTYSDSKLRRMVGVVWDVATFWPRAVHPLAPPCYTERVIPDLLGRIPVLVTGDDDRVVLSGHSQGSVIAAATVLHLDGDPARRVTLLTHGSPLRRLYATYFPAYFGAGSLAAVRDTVPKWVNLYRLSDPIGWPVFERVDPLGGDEALRAYLARQARGSAAVKPDGQVWVDWFSWDPALPESPGQPLAAALGHLDYWYDPPYALAFAYLSRMT